MEKIRKADPQLIEATTVEGIEYPPSLQFSLEQVGVEMEILCTKCMYVFKFMPFGTYLKEKDGKRALVGFVAPGTRNPLVCEDCREGRVM